MMKALNKQMAPKSYAPERIVQFGEGNFLRAFADWIVWHMNKRTDFNASVVVVQPIETGMADVLNGQDCMYHVNLQGLEHGKPVDSMTRIDCISRALNPYRQFQAFMAVAEQPEIRFVISNTTEAGIAFDPSCRLSDAPANSYPGKLTQFLYRRFCTFGGNPERGLIILPCELIFLNGHELRRCVLQYIDFWRDELGEDYEDFRMWFGTCCYVCSTLVDRIVSGFPKKDIEKIQARISYADRLVVQAEAFHLWVIERPDNMSIESLCREFPAEKAGMNVLITDNETPYHERKVTLLNGPHTVMSPVAFLCGVDIVREACQHPVLGRFVRKVMYDELMPTLNLPAEELQAFAASVLERFENPYVDHQLTSIMLNSFSKYKTRVLPGVKTYLERRGKLPEGLVLGLAAIITYYRGGERNDNTLIRPNDEAQTCTLLSDLWQTADIETMVREVLSAQDFIWKEHGDLNAIDGLPQMLSRQLRMIQERGMMETVKSILS